MEWRRSRKFPKYEVSATELVRNIKTKDIVPHKVDRERRRKVILVKTEFPIEAFTKELVYDEFPELRSRAA